MRKFCYLMMSFISMFGLMIMGSSSANDLSTIEEGKKIALDRTKGNCLACHVIKDGGEQPGNIGPVLFAIKERFPDKALLEAQIGDARTRNPNTIMPPFSTHGILTENELKKVTEYIYSL